MTHRFPIKEIARQAGLGSATVDRVLNERPHVSAQAHRRVHAAIEELKAQESQLAARGRRLFIDVIVEAPTRFSREVREATEAILPEIGPAICRPRFHFQEMMEEDEVVQTLGRIAKRGSHGLCIKARDTPTIRKAVNSLALAKIPVVTLATDLACDTRLDYVGLDNTSAGRTAAYLVHRSLEHGNGTVLATRSREEFLGEREREVAFVSAMALSRPGLRILSVQGGGGTGHGTERLFDHEPVDLRQVRAVYSMGGGNAAILDALERRGVRPEIFVAHDLDRENRRLLTNRRISYVLHHDLRSDIRSAFHAFFRFHRVGPAGHPVTQSTVQVITPENIPAR